MNMVSLQSEQRQYIIILISVIGVIFLGHMIYAHMSKMNQSKEIESVKDDNDGEVQSNIIMYGSDSCPWCKRQKEQN